MLHKLLILTLHDTDSRPICDLVSRSIHLRAQHLSLEIGLAKSLVLSLAVYVLLSILLRLILNDAVALENFSISLGPFDSRLSSLNLLL